MWEDESGWNSYADSNWGGDYGGYDDYSSSDWFNDGSGNEWSYDPGSWQQSYDYTPEVNWQPSQGNWQQSYDYEPRYTPGAGSNPYAAQITSGNPGPEQMYARMGGSPAAAMQGFHFYRNQPGYQNDPALVEGEHYAFGKHLMSNPLLNTTGVPQLVTMTLPPAYDALKFLGQNAPAWLQQYIPQFLTQASRPTATSAWAGMKPAFGR